MWPSRVRDTIRPWGFGGTRCGGKRALGCAADDLSCCSFWGCTLPVAFCFCSWPVGHQWPDQYPPAGGLVCSVLTGSRANTWNESRWPNRDSRNCIEQELAGAHVDRQKADDCPAFSEVTTLALTKSFLSAYFCCFLKNKKRKNLACLRATSVEPIFRGFRELFWSGMGWASHHIHDHQLRISPSSSSSSSSSCVGLFSLLRITVV